MVHRLYADENFPLQVVVALRQRGHKDSSVAIFLNQLSAVAKDLACYLQVLTDA